jgi:hypothetical protein
MLRPLYPKGKYCSSPELVWVFRGLEKRSLATTGNQTMTLWSSIPHSILFSYAYSDIPSVTSSLFFYSFFLFRKTVESRSCRIDTLYTAIYLHHWYRYKVLENCNLTNQSSSATISPYGTPQPFHSHMLNFRRLGPSVAKS